VVPGGVAGEGFTPPHSCWAGLLGLVDEVTALGKSRRRDVRRALAQLLMTNRSRIVEELEQRLDAWRASSPGCPII